MIFKLSFPVIHSHNTLQSLATWQNTLKNTIRNAQPPPTPLNFSATNTQGGIQLSWAPVQKVTVKAQVGVSSIGPDGYEIWRSPSGTFVTDLTIIKVPGAQSSAYFDSIGTTPTAVNYRIYATSGTPSAPQSVKGAPSGVVTNTSIAPTDVATVSTTVQDTYTNDFVRATSSRGHYGVNQYQFFRGVQ